MHFQIGPQGTQTVQEKNLVGVTRWACQKRGRENQRAGLGRRKRRPETTRAPDSIRRMAWQGMRRMAHSPGAAQQVGAAT
ncbi:hypothetical protein BOO71_0006475 [Deinococcus marmoris]|uniref:Uncharacterized protein n=1 Tax=Deinococcus marmoris TaxID=249408 RepID=A0A1U7NZ73_9DEIO|nr:hypothetical protein BOO71_0006475 [Deinococcus marmoris]